MLRFALDDSSVKLNSIIYAIVPTGKRNALGQWRCSDHPAQIEVRPVRITGIYLQSASLPDDLMPLKEEWTVDGFEYQKDRNPFSLRRFNGLRLQDCFSNIIEANVECARRINKVNGQMTVILEQCPECQEEVVIYNDGITPCPECGTPLAPCSVCGDCSIALCPYGCTGIDDPNRLKPTNPIVPLEVCRQVTSRIVEAREMQRIRESRMEAIKDFIRSEESTSKLFPWYVSAQEMLNDEEKLREVMRKLKWYNTEYDPDSLCELLEEYFGVNPEVKKS